MRNLSVLWAVHLLATVIGWYTLGAFAQGAADSMAPTPSTLIIFNEFIKILCFPLVLAATSFSPGLGAFRLGSFFVFVAIAAVNSAVIAAVVAAAIAALRHAVASRRDAGE